MKTITSIHNPLVVHATKLASRTYRTGSKEFIVEGKRACEPFLDSPYALVTLFITEEHHAWATERDIDEYKIIIVTPEIIKKITSTVTPSGIAAIFERPFLLQKPTLASGIVLANIQDPGNMGTLIRTATALNKQIIIIGGAHPFSPKIVQASAGALAHAQLFCMTWDELCAQAKEQNILLSALVVTGGKPISTSDKKQQRFLIVGNEAHGIPNEWIADCDDAITLPMPGNTESLNAAVAGSIALYMLTV